MIRRFWITYENMLKFPVFLVVESEQLKKKKREMSSTGLTLSVVRVLNNEGHCHLSAV